MNRQRMFQQYTAQRKEALPTGYRREDVNGVTRYIPIRQNLEGIVAFSELSEKTVDHAISEEIKYFEKIGRGFEWKVYDLDKPADLGCRLEAYGFVGGDSEAFMVYAVESHCRPHPRSFRIERVTTEDGIRQVVAVQEAACCDSFPWLEASLAEGMDRLAIFCAYLGTEPIGTGWLEFLDGTEFAELHGGAVLSSQRGLGVYSALFDVRAEEAKRRGIRFFAVDAAPMSRAILLKKGFSHVCETVPFRKGPNKPPQTNAGSRPPLDHSSACSALSSLVPRG